MSRWSVRVLLYIGLCTKKTVDVQTSACLSAYATANYTLTFISQRLPILHFKMAEDCECFQHKQHANQTTTKCKRFRTVHEQPAVPQSTELPCACQNVKTEITQCSCFMPSMAAAALHVVLSVDSQVQRGGHITDCRSAVPKPQGFERSSKF